MRIWLATSDRHAALSSDDQLLLHALADRGHAVAPLIWTNGVDPVAPSDAVVIRSCWDYHRRSDDFLRFVDSIECRGSVVINPGAVLRWNMHKRYLLQLERAAVRVAPTVLIEEAVQLREVLDHTTAWSREYSACILKPEISASSHGLTKLALPLSKESVEFIVATVNTEGSRSWLMQPFLSDIVHAGEVSLVYLGGTFSHAVRKRAAAGDFRVQSEYGGTIEPIDVDASLLETGNRVLAAGAALLGESATTLAYARVDLLEASPPILMELELIEPNLFLGYGRDAAGRLAAIIEMQAAAQFDAHSRSRDSARRRQAR